MTASMMRLRMAILIFVLALVTPFSVLAQGSGVLQGVVANGTAGGPEIGAGVVVNLHVIQGSADVQTLETTTDGQGRFRFDGLDTDPALEYWPEAVYQDVPTNGQEPYRFEEGQTEISAELMVYETTTDDESIRAGTVHIIAESFGQVLRLSEIHFYGNMGDRAYIGSPGEDGRPRTVFVPLPPGALGVAFGDEGGSERFVEGDGGLWDTEPVPPGPETSLVFFSYHLAVGGDTVPLEHQFAYPVDSLNILVAQPGLTLRSDQLESRGLESFQDRQYELYAASGLGPDAPLVVELVPASEGVTVPGSMAGAGETVAGGSAGGSQGTLRQIGWVLSFLAVGGVFVYAFATKGQARRRRAPDQAQDATSRRLLVELADLQEALETGEVDQADYDRRRAQIYEALQSL
jgi:hypothetical protein